MHSGMIFMSKRVITSTGLKGIEKDMAHLLPLVLDILFVKEVLDMLSYTSSYFSFNV